jgi:hypothetical protein
MPVSSLVRMLLSLLTDASVCSRRKVRCNEQKPRCSHCERLNLQCAWKPVTRMNQIPRQQSENGNAGHEAGIDIRSQDSSITVGSSVLNDARQTTVDGSFNDVFDYASFMWDHDSQNSTMQPARWPDLEFSNMDVLAQRDEMVSSELSP